MEYDYITQEYYDYETNQSLDYLPYDMCDMYQNEVALNESMGMHLLLWSAIYHETGYTV